MNLDNHIAARYPSRKPPAKQQQLNSLYNESPHSNSSNGHNSPALQLSISTSKPVHTSEMLEATKKMTKDFKKLYKNIKSPHVYNDNNHFQLSSE